MNIINAIIEDSLAFNLLIESVTLGYRNSSIDEINR